MIYLTLEDGTIYRGEGFGARADVMGEVVFNTGMTGYQEVLTDPSYCGQIVTMTYPLVGNYGINGIDLESAKPQVRAFVVREACDQPSNWRCESTLNAYLEKNNIVGLSGVDTRALTRRIREKGTMRGVITQLPPTTGQINEMRLHITLLPVDMVTCDKSYTYGSGSRRVAMLDFGLKRNILRSLESRGCTVTVFPARTSPKEILNGKFNGLMLSNGPGDPKENEEVIANIRQMVGKLPIFGICLGHQLLALAAGADTEKLKYGHRGLNHPVKDLAKNRIYITSQNHGYTVKQETLPNFVEVTHLSWNDQTIEGIRYTNADVFSVQFHPEASPGPDDSAYLFDEFMNHMDGVAKS